MGRAVGARFEAIGIHTVDQLVGADPVEVFARMEEYAGRPEDPCLLDTVLSAVDQAEGRPARPWWNYTERRRALLRDRRDPRGHVSPVVSE
ncbi:hypothetical protein BL253_22545 [Pseudofrankia asymbiotica]|uniref:Mitomycin resistance protein n=1 Tax=Pseudofrankia asymbiotica TaxID=1834516 RepID=A0A1V2I6Z7_9ACTN|nr:hypothetical protein BL253_22545 [Pseudofrankia asymbiotica]